MPAVYSNLPHKFYVYELCRPDGSVFYVGKGSGHRIIAHEYGARIHPNHICHNPKKCLTIRKVMRAGRQIQKTIVFTTDSEQEAFDYERKLIAHYSKQHLVNVTDGGEGPVGMKATALTKAKLSAMRKGKPKSEAHRQAIAAANKGRVITSEARARISATLTGKKLAPGVIEKVLASRKGYSHSQTTRDKIGAANKLVKRTVAEKLQRSKLTADQIAELRALHATGRYTLIALSKRFDICLSSVHRIVHGHSHNLEAA